jgi:uncharacterized protein YdiU (UPF0061 family)
MGILKMKITNSYHKLGECFYKEQNPDKVQNPELIIFNENLAKELSLQLNKDKKHLAELFSGNKLPPNSKPISLAYAGHQFGHFVPQLGDGRAVLIGEVEDSNNILHDMQLKGSGRTFFSRDGDGKCPLDASIREYIVSEAMNCLKITTSRSLAIVKSDEFIEREKILPASVITRIANSHIRIGTFEYFAARGEIKNLKILADYAINRHFRECQNQNNKYLNLLSSVIKLQADLVSSWMSVGFIHGVMNTDNILISGQTIDYGPCAFIDEYQSSKVFSFIDKMGRYSFANQKNIILWNLNKFAGSILPLIDTNINNSIELAEKELYKFPDMFDGLYYEKMANKIGIFNFRNKKEDMTLVDDFLKILEKNNIDFTNGFRVLSKILLKKKNFYSQDKIYLEWSNKWIEKLKSQKISFDEIAKKMDKINPILIPRNHLIADIIKKSVFQNDYKEFFEFIKATQNPFVENKKYNKYYSPPNENQRVKNTFCGT